MEQRCSYKWAYYEQVTFCIGKTWMGCITPCAVQSIAYTVITALHDHPLQTGCINACNKARKPVVVQLGARGQLFSGKTDLGGAPVGG